MQQFASDAPPNGSIGEIRGLSALGEEAPLRNAIEGGERLLLCALVRFADRTSSQPLWVTDQRFVFTRSQGRLKKLLVNVPLAGGTLECENTGLYPLHLTWMASDGRPCSASFRTHTWKDAMRSEQSAGAAGGATGGIAGALIGAALDAAIQGAAGKRGVASKDQKLFAALVAVQRAPGQVRPVDLTLDAFTRWLVGGFTGLVTAALIAAGVFALGNYQAEQAYEAAPVCGSVPSSDCRLLEPAVVLSYRGAGGTNAYCDLFLSKDDGSTVEADLHTFNLCANDPRGQQMFLESWRHSLTGVIPVGAPTRVIPTQETADNPGYNWRFGEVMAGILGLIWIVFGTLALTVVIGWFKRRSLLRSSARAAGYL